MLEDLGVRAFVYTLEQKEGGWVLSAAVRAKLRAAWAPHLAACAG